MCAACATIRACASNTAQEKSSRSRMLGLKLARCKVTPISSATDANRFLNTSREMGSMGMLWIFQCAISEAVETFDNKSRLHRATHYWEAAGGSDLMIFSI